MANTKPLDWTDDTLIREIRAGGLRREKAWEYIYKAWRGYYLAPILKAGGVPEQVDNVLGQVVTDVEKQIQKADFMLRKASLKVYFTECVKRSWLRSVPQPRQLVEFDPQSHSTGQHESVEDMYIRQERMQRLDALLAQLGERCRGILVNFARGFAMAEIAEDLGIQEQSAKNEKLKCHRKLLELTDEL